MTTSEMLIPSRENGADNRSKTSVKRGQIGPEEIDIQRQFGRLVTLAKRMDSAFQIPGTGIVIGWDAILGMVPGIGDAVSAGISLWIIRQARQLGASRWLVARMLWNVALDAGLGTIPILGDAFDVAWKANGKNVELLRRHLESRLRRQ